MVENTGVPSDPQQLFAEIRRIVLPDTIDEIGIAGMSAIKPEDAAAAQKIREQLRGAASIIIIVKKLAPQILATAPSPEYQTEVRANFDSLHRCAARLADWLHEAGVAACWPGSQKTPHQKGFAVAAGLGEIGDSGLFASYEYGVGVQLETILTGITPPIAGTTSIAASSALRRCVHCSICASSCPAGAIVAGVVDREKCLGYRRGVINGYCGICMRVCAARNH
jgi:epoxyqueuosine reductase QueG